MEVRNEIGPIATSSKVLHRPSLKKNLLGMPFHASFWFILAIYFYQKGRV